MIFDLLTTWNKQNVENFFILLQQFIYEYSHPLLHDGDMRLWELSYGADQVNINVYVSMYVNNPFNV